MHSKTIGDDDKKEDVRSGQARRERDERLRREEANKEEEKQHDCQFLSASA